MVITWYGASCIKVETQDTVLVFNPFQKSAAWGADRSPRFRANIVCVSADDPLYNAVAGLEGEPFSITSAGEYEVGGITVTGILHINGKGVANTVFMARAEGVRIVHLGAWAGGKLPETVSAPCAGADVLCVPIGAGALADPTQAAAIAAQLEAGIVVPVMYRDAPGDKEPEPLMKFSKALGVPIERLDRLSVRKKDAASDRTVIAALRAQLAK